MKSVTQTVYLQDAVKFEKQNGEVLFVHYDKPFVFDKTLQKELKEKYVDAVSNGKDKFMFHTRIVLTEYAKFVLIVLEEHLGEP